MDSFDTRTWADFVVERTFLDTHTGLLPNTIVAMRLLCPCNKVHFVFLVYIIIITNYVHYWNVLVALLGGINDGLGMI